MLTLIGLVAAGLCVYLGYRWLKPNAVTSAWLRDSDRREWTRGIDGVCWQWPKTDGR